MCSFTEQRTELVKLQDCHAANPSRVRNLSTLQSLVFARMRAGNWFLCIASVVAIVSFLPSEQSTHSEGPESRDVARREPSPVGLTNTANNCYLNALIASLNALPEFRRMTYSNFQRSPALAALGLTFARLNISAAAVDPILDIGLALRKYGIEWHFNDYECIHEMFSNLLEMIPENILNPYVGIGWRERLYTHDKSTKNGYLISEPYDEFQINTIINLYMPHKKTIKKIHNLSLQGMIFGEGQENSRRELTIRIEDHWDFFNRQGWHTTEQTIEVVARTEYLLPSQIVPIYLNRRVRIGESNETNASTASIIVPDELYFDSHGTTHELTSFVCYEDGHYYAYARVANKMPTVNKRGERITSWNLLNDDTSTVVTSSNSTFIKDKTTKATLFFYTKIEPSGPAPEAPPLLVQMARYRQLVEGLLVELPQSAIRALRLDKKTVKEWKSAMHASHKTAKAARALDRLARMDIDPYRNVTASSHEYLKTEGDQQGQVRSHNHGELVNTSSKSIHMDDIYEEEEDLTTSNPFSKRYTLDGSYTEQGSIAPAYCQQHSDQWTGYNQDPVITSPFFNSPVHSTQYKWAKAFRSDYDNVPASDDHEGSNQPPKPSKKPEKKSKVVNITPIPVFGHKK
jgi:hypothetical protein